ncbi:MAG: NAD(P)/FAD-dependent oxidoreductase [Proteobacteria bacterium]|nr:NAD(P)/FAD-dependent oxidoreductase [Pseudomonadota bacterium]
MTHVVIVGGGFAGLRAARDLGGVSGIEVTLYDERNHHLFQPLLYQVAMAGLSPAEIAAPIRSLVSRHRNIRVLNERVERVDLDTREILTARGRQGYDVLVLAAGARHSYFGHPEWEANAPGLKTLAQATEIRRRVLCAFEDAEKEEDDSRQGALLTFVVVGGGPTGVELAGALGEMSRFTLARDFRRVDPKLARIILVEAGPRILPMFSERLASRAVRDLESLGVQVWTQSLVTRVSAEGIEIGTERVEARTTLWAAGVEASFLNRSLEGELDRQGRIRVNADLSLPDHPEVFIAGDQASVSGRDEQSLPAIAPVAMQQGAYLASRIRDAERGRKNDRPFVYVDKGQMATIGRSRAVLQIGRFELSGFPAWLIWLLVHVYFLVGFKNRAFVVMQWAWAYLTFRRGARLILDRIWRDHPEAKASED